MPKPETENIDPRWLTFWRRVKAAAEQLSQVEAAQAESGEPQAE